jgi:hypothetical protein
LEFAQLRVGQVLNEKAVISASIDKATNPVLETPAHPDLSATVA